MHSVAMNVIMNPGVLLHEESPESEISTKKLQFSTLLATRGQQKEAENTKLKSLASQLKKESCVGWNISMSWMHCSSDAVLSTIFLFVSVDVWGDTLSSCINVFSTPFYVKKITYCTALAYWQNNYTVNTI